MSIQHKLHVNFGICIEFHPIFVLGVLGTRPLHRQFEFAVSVCVCTACFSAAQDQNLAPHLARKNDAVVVVVHLHRHPGLEAVLHAVDQSLVQRAPVQDRGLSHVPTQDLLNGPVQGRRGLVFML